MKAYVDSPSDWTMADYPSNHAETTTEIIPTWSEYDKTVARCHLSNYGRIYLDWFSTASGLFCTPCDDEYEVEQRYQDDVAGGYAAAN